MAPDGTEFKNSGKNPSGNPFPATSEVEPSAYLFDQRNPRYPNSLSLSQNGRNPLHLLIFLPLPRTRTKLARSPRGSRTRRTEPLNDVPRGGSDPRSKAISFDVLVPYQLGAKKLHFHHQYEIANEPLLPGTPLSNAWEAQTTG